MKNFSVLLFLWFEMFSNHNYVKRTGKCICFPAFAGSFHYFLIFAVSTIALLIFTDSYLIEIIFCQTLVADWCIIQEQEVCDLVRIDDAVGCVGVDIIIGTVILVSDHTAAHVHIFDHGAIF